MFRSKAPLGTMYCTALTLLIGGSVSLRLAILGGALCVLLDWIQRKKSSGFTPILIGREQAQRLNFRP